MTEYFSANEVRDQLRHLSAEDRVRLVRMASAFAIASSLTAEDIFGQAVVASLSGARRRRRDLELIPFLFGAMKSIAYSERKKAEKRPLDNASESDVDVVDTAVNCGDAPALMISEEEAHARIQLLTNLVSNNENAAYVLDGWLDDMSPAEIREASGMSETQYDSARRYLKRRLNALKQTRQDL